MALDIKKFLGELGFTPDKVEEMAPKFESGHVSALEARYADPAKAKKLAELESLEQQLNDRNNQLNLELSEWATLTASEKEAAGKLRADLEASQQEVLRLNQAVTRVATQAGIDPTTVLPKASEAPAPKKESEMPNFNPNDYARASDFQAISNFMLDLPSKLLRASREHHALTGEDLDTDAIVAEVRKLANQKGADVDPIKIWERMHDIPAKRKARDDERRTGEIRDAETRGYERARTEQALTPTATPGKRSPVLVRRNDSGQFLPRESALKRPQPETAVRSAAAAFSTGKYRQKAG